ncbi:MAG: hypothetical protein M1817_001025 [Caeruleum heppii]|nr:MAG: hypothetical protein M1817_001025 [Caeruleum heppii]
MISTRALTTLILSASLLSFTTATPTPAELAPRSCVTQYPNLIQHIYEVSPDSGFQQDNFFEIAYDVVSGDNSRLWRRDVVVQWDNIPAGSYGCQIEAFFPPRNQGGNVNQYGNSLVDVYAVDEKATISDTWNTAPKRAYLFGTIRFETKENEPVKRVINSQVCNSTLTYRFTISSNTDVGEVYFQQGPGFNNQGLRLTHNC